VNIRILGFFQKKPKLGNSFADSMRDRYWGVIAAASTKPFGFKAFYSPAQGWGGIAFHSTRFT